MKKCLTKMMILIAIVTAKVSVDDIQEVVVSTIRKDLHSSILNPIFGYLFESTKSLENFRFFSPYIETEKNGSFRDFSKDSSNDEATKLVIDLFPSTDGVLDCFTNSNENLLFKFQKDKSSNIQEWASKFNEILETVNKTECSNCNKIFDMNLIRLLTIQAFIINALDTKEELKQFVQLICTPEHANVYAFHSKFKIAKAISQIHRESNFQFPYFKLNQPTQNSFFCIFDRNSDGRNSESFYSDPVSIQVLNICNILLYDSVRKCYSFQHLAESSNLRKFYERHANPTDLTPELKKDWARVIQNLSDSEKVKENDILKTHEIKYTDDKRTQLRRGVINLMNVLIKLYGIDHINFWESFDGNSLTFKLQKLFSLIKPNFEYREVKIMADDSQLKKVETEKDEDFEGSFNLIIKVSRLHEIEIEITNSKKFVNVYISKHYKSYRFSQIDISKIKAGESILLELFSTYIALSQDKFVSQDRGTITSSNFFGRIFFCGSIKTDKKLLEILIYIFNSLKEAQLSEAVSIPNIVSAKKLVKLILKSVDLTNSELRKVFLPVLFISPDLKPDEVLPGFIESLNFKNSDFAVHWKSKISELRPKNFTIDFDQFRYENLPILLYVLLKDSDADEVHFSRIKPEYQEKIFEKLKRLEDLKVLDLSGNQLTERRVRDLNNLLFKFRNLKALNLSGNQLNYTGIVIIEPFLKELKHLKNIDFSLNNISNESREILGNILKNFQNLENINLSQNQLDPENLGWIINEIPYENQIKHLDVSNNNLNQETFSDFSSAIIALWRLNSLNCSRSALTSDSLEELLKYISTMNHLKHLDLSNNRFSYEDRYQANFKNAMEDLKKIKSLTHFDFSENKRLNEEGCRLLMTSISELPNIEVLKLSNLNFNSESIDILYSFIQNSQNLKLLNLSKINISKDELEKIKDGAATKNFKLIRD